MSVLNWRKSVSCFQWYILSRLIFFACVELLFATFVWSFVRLIFPSELFSIFRSHSCRVLGYCFFLLAFQSRFFSIPISSLLVYAGNGSWMNCSNSSKDIVEQASSWLILLQVGSFCYCNFFPRWSNMFIISSRTKNKYLGLFISFIWKVTVLAFSNIVVDKIQLCSMF